MSYLFKQEIEALMPPPAMGVAEWVEKHRILPIGNAEPGPKRIDRTPNLRAVYDWFGDYRVREITCQKPAQCGFTDMIVDFILWICENDPSPTALFLADQGTAKKIMKYRIIPALKGLGRLKNDFSSRKKEATSFECSFSNGFYLMVSWGSSIAQTASMAFKYIFCDEINKPGYDVSGDEGDALGRIRERMETYFDSKFIKFSTPTTDLGRVTKELKKADVIYDYCVPCPDCGFLQPLTFKNVHWEGGSKATTEQIEQTARYVCCNCGSMWTTEQKNNAVEEGVFIPREQVNNPRHIGLQLHRLTSLFSGGYLEKMIARWNKAQDDGPGEMQNVINSIFGEPWINRATPPTNERMAILQKCILDYEKDSVPQEAVCLVAGVDVQKYGFWYRVRAFAQDTTSWGIDEGYCETWDELKNVLFHNYGGKRIWRTLIDTGGSENNEEKTVSRTEETYFFIRENQKMGMRIMGSKGSSHAMATKIKIGQPLDKTASGKPIPGGIRIVSIDTDYFKDLFWWRVENAANNEPKGLYFHNQTDENVLKHYVAEEKIIDKNGKSDWVNIGKRANHLFDCEVLCLACIDDSFFGGIKAAFSAPPVIHHNNSETNTVKKRRPNPFTQGIY